jgi:hypothetical protein
MLTEVQHNVVVQPIEPKDLPTVKDWILNKHYIARWPTAVQAKLGVYHDGKLVGILLYGSTLHPTAGGDLFKDKEGKSVLRNNQVWELLRAFTTDAAKKEVPNLGSIVISKGNDWIRTHAKTKGTNLPIKGILSYADPEASHSGTVYKATNAAYLGPQKPVRVLVIHDPKSGITLDMHQMSLAKYHTSNIEKLSKMEPFVGKKLEWKQVAGKHKYLYALGKDQKDRDHLMSQLAVPLMSYPEPGKTSTEIPNPAKEKKPEQKATPQKSANPTDKKSAIKQFLSSTVMNPETGHKILVKTALGYDKTHPSYKQARGMLNAYSKKYGIRIKDR